MREILRRPIYFITVTSLFAPENKYIEMIASKNSSTGAVQQGTEQPGAYSGPNYPKKLHTCDVSTRAVPRLKMRRQIN